jgi:hypothetical protein
MSPEVGLITPEQLHELEDRKRGRGKGRSRGKRR